MRHLDDIRLLIHTLLRSTQFHALVIQSKPGWGKSSIVESVLAAENVSYRSLGSYSTPLFLYKSICENPNQFIVIDDCAGLFHDPVAMSILKAATWKSSGSGDLRQVTWGTTSERVDADSVIFSGKFILLTNGQMNGRETKAFLSRTLHLSFDFSPSESARLLKQAAQNKEIFADTRVAKKVASELSRLLISESSPDISFRTLRLGYELAELHPETWPRLLRLLIKKTETSPVKMELVISDEKVKVADQFKVFHQSTGFSRRTFFNYRRRLADGKPLPAGARVQRALLRTSIPRSNPLP